MPKEAIDTEQLTAGPQSNLQLAWNEGGSAPSIILCTRIAEVAMHVHASPPLTGHSLSEITYRAVLVGALHQQQAVRRLQRLKARVDALKELVLLLGCQSV